MATQLLPPSPQLSEPKAKKPSLGFTWEELPVPTRCCSHPGSCSEQPGNKEPFQRPRS